jgi:hypothetical protein
VPGGFRYGDRPRSAPSVGGLEHRGRLEQCSERNWRQEGEIVGVRDDSPLTDSPRCACLAGAHSNPLVQEQIAPFPPFAGRRGAAVRTTKALWRQHAGLSQSSRMFLEPGGATRVWDGAAAESRLRRQSAVPLAAGGHRADTRSRNRHEVSSPNDAGPSQAACTATHTRSHFAGSLLRPVTFTLGGEGARDDSHEWRPVKEPLRFGVENLAEQIASEGGSDGRNAIKPEQTSRLRLRPLGSRPQEAPI